MMLSITLLIGSLFLLGIAFLQIPFYAFRWYEISNRAYDPEVTWYNSLAWKKWRPVRSFINECFYIAIYDIALVLWPFITLFSKNPTHLKPSKFVADKPIIILIHGYMAQPIHFWLMRLRLKIKKMPNVVTFDYQLAGSEIEQYRERLREFVLQLQTETGIKSLLFIGHSFGGILAHDYSARYEQEEEVKGLITLGAPFRGSRLASLALSPLARRLHPESSMLSKIVNTRLNIPFVSIYSRFEQVVLPYTNAEHPLADENIEVDTCGHSGYFLDGKVFKIVYEKLLPFS